MTVWDFSGIYADEGISGKSKEKRTEFMRMIRDCEGRKVDMIVTKSQFQDLLEILRTVLK